MIMPTVLFLVLGEKLLVTFFLGLLWRRLMLCDSVFCRWKGKSIIGFTVPRTNSFRKYSKVFFILYYATNDNKSKNNFSFPWSSLIGILIDTLRIEEEGKILGNDIFSIKCVSSCRFYKVSLKFNSYYFELFIVDWFMFSGISFYDSSKVL